MNENESNSKSTTNGSHPSDHEKNNSDEWLSPSELAGFNSAVEEAQAGLLPTSPKGKGISKDSLLGAIDQFHEGQRGKGKFKKVRAKRRTTS